MKAQSFVQRASATTAAPMYTKIRQVVEEFLKREGESVASKSEQKRVDKLTSDIVGVMGRDAASKAEQFLQRDASSATWKKLFSSPEHLSPELKRLMEELEICVDA